MKEDDIQPAAKTALGGKTRSRGAPVLEWPVQWLFGLLGAALLGIGWFYLQHQQRSFREAAQRELQAIADLKIQQIVNWRKERSKDANLLRATPYVARRALDVLAQPQSSTTRSMFTGFLVPLLRGAGYYNLLLLDEHLNVCLAYPKDTSQTLTEEERQSAAQALRTRRVFVSDLHRSKDESRINLDFVVPLVVRREGARENVPAAGLPDSALDRGAGLLVLRVDVRHFLFPLIQTWPTSSETAETLLVRRDGDEVLYLNELRHQKGTVLTLRRPLKEARLTSAMALRGEQGVFEGVDYRGVPVVAAARPVPDTGWVMVAKVDQAELYAPLRQQAYIVGVVELTLLLAAGASIAAWWRRQRERWLKEQLAVERERAAIAARFEHLMRQANDVVLLADSQGKIIEANQRAVQFYGWSMAELRGLALEDLGVRKTAPEKIHEPEMVFQPCSTPFETCHQRKDGSIFPVEVSVNVVEFDAASLKLAIVRDITQRKAAEVERERLIRELQEALANVKILGGLLPICSHCKKIRDDKGYWERIESYISSRSGAQFTHGICPECVASLYPELRGINLDA